MKKYLKFLLAAFILFSSNLLFSINNDEELGDKQKLRLIRAYYDTAIQHFQREEYGKAIKYWDQILKLDPEQIQPHQLIAIAREKMTDKNKKLFGQMEKLYAEGEYTLALKNITEIIGPDSSDPIMTDVKSKLETIVNNIGDIKGKNRAANLTRNALLIYIEDKDNKKTMLNEILYASQIDNRIPNLKKFVDNLFKEFPKEAKSINVVPGMDIVEQKLNASLNYIYDAKYDQAVLECNEILEFEPENIMALKRLGSAYYALGKKVNAKKAWQVALKYNPGDEELKEFLKQ